MFTLYRNATEFRSYAFYILFQIKLLLFNNLIWSLIKLFKISIQMHMHFKTEKKICLCVVKEDTYCLWILISYMYA